MLHLEVYISSIQTFPITPSPFFFFNSPPLMSLGFNVGRSAGGRSTLREINRDACHFPGFPVMQTLLPKHTNVPELYFLLMALFLQQPVIELPDSLQVHVSIRHLFFFISPTIIRFVFYYLLLLHPLNFKMRFEYFVLDLVEI